MRQTGIKIKGLSTTEVVKAFPFTPVLIGYRGSIAHNMYLHPEDPNSTDDKDMMGVFIASGGHYFGLDHIETVETTIKEYDIVSYEFRKFIRLLYKGNPNVLSMLWLDKKHYVHISEEGKALLAHKGVFVGKHVFHSFNGYAYSQLKRMESGSKEGYMGEKRKALVEKYGYDCKNASHLIRLLRMGIEFLNEGELHVSRPDAPQLLEIKKGKWSLEKVKEEATYLFKRAEEAYDRSILPVKPDYDTVNELTQRILTSYWKAYY